MLTIFPELLNFSFLGVFILRIAIAIFVFMLSCQLYKNRAEIILTVQNRNFPMPAFLTFFGITIYFLVAIALFVGIFTQIALIIAALSMFKLIILNFVGMRFLKHDNFIYTVFILISLAALFLGAGAFAFDLPI